MSSLEAAAASAGRWWPGESFPSASTVLLTLFLVGSMSVFSLGAFWRRSPRPFLNSARQTIYLVDRQRISGDTQRLRFALSGSGVKLGLPPGMHIRVFGPNREGKVPGEWNGRKDPETGLGEIARVFTPVSGDDLPGFVDFVIKGYAPTERFVDGGKLSRWLCELPVGARVVVQGPVGRIKYTSPGQFELRGTPLPPCRRIVGIAGGSGITPIVAIARHILQNADVDKTEIAIISANRTEADVLLRNELEEMQTHHPKQVKLWYTVDRFEDGGGAENWPYSTGYVTHEIIRDRGFDFDEHTVAVICGPKPMKDNAVKPALAKLGFPEHRIVDF